MEEVTRQFRAMNTDMLVIVAAQPVPGAPAAPALSDLPGKHDAQACAHAALDEVERLFATVEACASRFRPESELSQLNRAAGRPFVASPMLFGLVQAALRAAAQTGGAFDPTLLSALEAAGYDRSFERLDGGEPSGAAHAGSPAAGAATGAPIGTPAGIPVARPIAPIGRPGAATSTTVAAASPAGWRAMYVEPSTRTIGLPPGCRIDLGGIGKGWTVDRAVALLREQGFTSFAVDAGGDLYAEGRQGNGTPWTVGIADPHDPERDMATLVVDGRAVATSTTARRRWQTGGEIRHHLIDPRTGRPSTSGVASATVVADTVAHAETLAKAALVLGPEDGRALLERSGVAGVLILDSGALVHTGALPLAPAA